MYKSYIYLSSGQADDYKAQMEYNKSILLNPDIKECYLCPVNNEQGPLMHMPVVEDIINFTNSVNSSFYQKDWVVVDTNLCIQSEK